MTGIMASIVDMYAAAWVGSVPSFEGKFENLVSHPHKLQGCVLVTHLCVGNQASSREVPIQCLFCPPILLKA